MKKQYTAATGIRYLGLLLLVSALFLSTTFFSVHTHASTIALNYVNHYSVDDNRKNTFLFCTVPLIDDSGGNNPASSYRIWYDERCKYNAPIPIIDETEGQTIYFKELTGVLDKLPQAVLDAVTEAGYTITVVDDIPDAYGEILLPLVDGRRAVGYTITATRTILVDKDYLVRTTIHEIGHAYAFTKRVEFYYDGCSYNSSLAYTPRWGCIYAAEMFQVFNSELENRHYMAKNKTEFFADAFVSYIEDPAKLKATAPLAYEYVEHSIYYPDDLEWFTEGVVKDRRFLVGEPDYDDEGKVDGFKACNFFGNTWKQTDGKRYYVNGLFVQTGWQNIDGQWYYFDETGVMSTSWKLMDGSWYYFGTDGISVPGFRLISDNWYYFGPDGKMKTGWISVDGALYYFNPDGRAATGWRMINGRPYYFNEKGKKS